MDEIKKIFYVYYSFEESGRGYIGYRKCPEGKNPELDTYLGSSCDKTFKPICKTILKRNLTQREAIAVEIYFQRKYEVAEKWNKDFANLAYQTSIGFKCDNSGMIKINNGIKNKYIFPDEEIPEGFILGGLPSSEETKQKISRAISGENNPRRGKKCYNNGIEQRYISPDGEIPDGYTLGGLPSSEERKRASSKGGKKASKYMSNSKWINNGITNKRVPKDYCISEGWKLGKVKNNKNRLEKELLRLEKSNKRKIEKELRIKERKKIIIDSGIKYSTIGWIKKLSNLLGISISCVRKWTKRYMPEFYSDYGSNIQRNN
jgi:hypothetical protein